MKYSLPHLPGTPGQVSVSSEPLVSHSQPAHLPHLEKSPSNLNVTSLPGTRLDLPGKPVPEERILKCSSLDS